MYKMILFLVCIFEEYGELVCSFNLVPHMVKVMVYVFLFCFTSFMLTIDICQFIY